MDNYPYNLWLKYRYHDVTQKPPYLKINQETNALDTRMIDVPNNDVTTKSIMPNYLLSENILYMTKISKYEYHTIEVRSNLAHR
jgi:hypothetical protein